MWCFVKVPGGVVIVMREVIERPHSDAGDEDDATHLAQILFAFAPHVAHGGLEGRDAVGGSSITKGVSSSPNQNFLSSLAVSPATSMPNR